MNKIEDTDIQLEILNSVPTTLNYWARGPSPDPSTFLDIFSGSHSQLAPTPTTILNIRPIATTFSFSTHGFQLVQHRSSLLPPQRHSSPPTDFHDQSLQRDIYWPESLNLLKSALGARSAVAVSSSVRDASTVQKLDPANPRANPRQSLHPFHVVHADYTAAGARAQLRAVQETFFADIGCMTSTTPAERDQFLRLRREIIDAENAVMKEEGVTDFLPWSGKNYAGPRWGWVSVWRPIALVKRDPLAVLDGQCIDARREGEAYTSVDRVYRDRPGFEKEFKNGNVLVYPPRDSGEGEGEEHRWYYVEGQRTDEVLILKLFDSEGYKEDGKACGFGAHSAFGVKGTEGLDARRSVEVRALVIW